MQCQGNQYLVIAIEGIALLEKLNFSIHLSNVQNANGILGEIYKHLHEKLKVRRRA